MNNVFETVPENLQRSAMVAHMHELAIKSQRCEIMMRETYMRMLNYADNNGIALSKILPVDFEDGVVGAENK